MALAAVAFSGCAAPVDEGMATRAAFYYLQEAPPPDLDGGRRVEFRDPENLLSVWTGGIIGYVFEIEPTGFLVLSADTRIEPLVAYSGTSDFPWDDSPENSLLDILLLDLDERLYAAEQGAIPSAACNEAVWNLVLELSGGMGPRIADASGALVSCAMSAAILGSDYTTTGRCMSLPDAWHQGDPFNALCPEAESVQTRCKAGCVALAMAQIVAHYGCPADVVIPAGTAYEVEGTDRSLASDRSFALAFPASATAMPDDTTAARLCAAAGLSVHMDYGPEASGAVLKDAASALQGVWHFQSADVIGLKPCSATPSPVSEDAFVGRLQSEAGACRPMLLSLSGVGGKHAVVCDGWEREETAGCWVDRYHLRAAQPGAGVDVWYSLPTEMGEANPIVLYGIVNIRPPADCGAAAGGVAITVDKGCGGVYVSHEPIRVVCAVGTQGAADLIDFDPSSPASPQRIPFDTTRSATQSLSGYVLGRGVETFVLRVSTSSRTDMSACRIVIDADSSLLSAASVTTQRGCDAAFSAGERLEVTYSVSRLASTVRIYVLTSQSIRLLTSAPLTSAAGTVRSETTIGPAKGDRMLVLIAETPDGTVAATCRYTVP